MSDSEPCAKRFKSSPQATYKLNTSEFSKHRNNRYRKDRRKRSTNRYYQTLKRKRTNRSTEELCEATSVFCITDNMATGEYRSPMKDVADWWKHDQVAYWKARALSLELENRMLHDCLRNAYGKQVYCYELSKKWEQEQEEIKAKADEVIVDEEKLPPKEGVREERRREMDRLYGGMAPKIIGMETAVQLNYELQVDQCKPPYWPNIPLNL